MTRQTGSSVEETAMLRCAQHAVERFARRCIEHPQIEKDPQCVIATLREEYRLELEHNIHEQLMILPTPSQLKQTATTNGQSNGKANNHHQAHTKTPGYTR